MKKFGILAFLAMLAMNAVTAEAVKGGPQPAEMAKMLQQCDKELQRNKAWTDAAVKRQQEAENKLNKDFAALFNENK